MSKATNRWLVTGASGFVGRQLCAEIVRRGWQVKAALRTPDSPKNGGGPVIVGPIDSQTSWIDALRNVEVVVHLAARVHVMRDDSVDPLSEFRRINTAGTEHLARCAAAARVKRLVYVSSIKVNGEETIGGHSYTELDGATPQDPYGISKWEAEQALHSVTQETGLEVVILRPPLIYGPGVKGNFAQMLNIVSRGIPLPFASLHNQRSLIYLGNLVDALITCAIHPAAPGKTFLVCDGEDVSTPDLLRRLAAAMGVPSRLLPCPAALLRFAGSMVGKSQQMERLLGSLQVDGDKIRRDLNWVPPYSLQQGLQA
ncbi:partial UDP-glucose 4-epimerase, partial [Methylophilaceae bacterium]